jgi:signal transduction histidine kinase
MSKTGLLTLTLRNYLLAFMAMLILFFGVFYMIMRMEVKHNIDEILFNRKNNIIAVFESEGGQIPTEAFNYTDFKITQANLPIQESYSDTLIFEPTDQEFDEYRKLETSFTLKDKTYNLEIVKAHLETGEIVHTILLYLGLIFLLMLALFYLTTIYFSSRTWQPFYNTLRKLKTFELENVAPIKLDESKITEFDSLNHAITELTERVQRAFISQKQFIENAAHEMQTPLAIIQNQLELLIANPQLTEFQSEKITRVLDSTRRITQLNKVLQLISKIENSQFIEAEKCRLKPMVEKVLTYFDGQQENLEIKVDLKLEDITIDANATLLDVLITNLIKNAFLHNVKNGIVDIKLQNNGFEITNTSQHSELPREKLFQRFFKQGQNKESWGLGLAISKRICEINSWRLLYSSDSKKHTFAVHFNK